MFKNNRNLIIIALIAIVNALGYGIIIPIIYSYSLRFGLSVFENGLLFAIFSLFQFLSTPIIGRMSDKYGRKPLLLISIAGTGLSFFIAAFAPSALFLFFARALDGATAGNIPVATAVISDTTAPKDRVKGFGVIGASFGFGMLFGPAISALTVNISPSLPFIIAGIISFIAVGLTAVLLPETNKNIGEIHHSKLFDPKKLLVALEDVNIGKTLLITLFFSFAFAMFISTFQPFALNILKLSAFNLSLIYTLFGIIGVIAQTLILPALTKHWSVKQVFPVVLIVNAVVFMGLSQVRSLIPFIAIAVVLSLSNSLIQPLISTILSQEADERSQGSIFGLNASYMSIGQILGPIVGGGLGTLSLSYPFIAGSLSVLTCFWLSYQIFSHHLRKEHLFS